jgi:hypothetical protein
MILAAFILILSTALFFSYCQAICQRILRREFSQEFFQTIVSANRLEFPSIRRAIEEFAVADEYPRIRVMLKGDYAALTYLLKNAARTNRRYSAEERVLLVYCRLLFMSLVLHHLLKLAEEPTILKMTAVLQYFANVVGERVHAFSFASLDPLGHLS